MRGKDGDVRWMAPLACGKQMEVGGNWKRAATLKTCFDALFLLFGQRRCLYLFSMIPTYEQDRRAGGRAKKEIEPGANARREGLRRD